MTTTTKQKELPYIFLDELSSEIDYYSPIIEKKISDLGYEPKNIMRNFKNI